MGTVHPSLKNMAELFRSTVIAASPILYVDDEDEEGLIISPRSVSVGFLNSQMGLLCMNDQSCPFLSRLLPQIEYLV